MRVLRGACQDRLLWSLLRCWIVFEYLLLRPGAETQHQWIIQSRCRQPAYANPEYLISKTVRILETSPAMFRTCFRRTKDHDFSVSYFRSASLTRNATDMEHKNKEACLVKAYKGARQILLSREIS